MVISEFSLIMILQFFHSDHPVEILVSLRFSGRSGLVDLIILRLRYVGAS